MNLKVVYRKNEHRRVLRGGYCNGYASYLRAAYRFHIDPSSQGSRIGARLSKSLGGKNEPKDCI